MDEVTEEKSNPLLLSGDDCCLIFSFVVLFFFLGNHVSVFYFIFLASRLHMLFCNLLFFSPPKYVY